MKAISYKAEKKGKELLQFFRENNPDVRTLMSEMRVIANLNFELFDEWSRNKADFRAKRVGLSIAKKQDKLSLAMNYNVKAEWIPRFKYLKEIQDSFSTDHDLFAAFIKFRKINKSMRKLTLWNRNLINFYEDLIKDSIKNSKITLKDVAIVAACTVAVTAGFASMLNNAGKDLGSHFIDKPD